MKTYNSYEEAKIANPDEDIYFYKGKYQIGSAPCRLGEMWSECDPADHCMTVEKFLADGHKFVEGDLILDEGSIYLVADCKSQSNWYETESANMPDCDDDRRLTLRAAALEEKPKRVNVEHVKVEDSIFDLRADFEAGELFVKIGDNYEVVLSAQCLATSLAVGSCYRKVETEIDERQEFIDECMAHGGLRARDGAREVYGNIFDSGKFKLVNAD